MSNDNPKGGENPKDPKGNDGADPKGGNDNPKGGSGDGDITIPKDRFDEMSSRAKKAEAELKKLKDAEAEREKKRLEEQGEYKQLAEQRENELKTYKAQVAEGSKRNAVVLAAAKLGANDPQDIINFVSLSDIEVAEDGNIDAGKVEEIVKRTKESKPYLFGSKAKPTVGAGGNPSKDGNEREKPTFKRSQLRDHSFYKEHEKEIQDALREGRIIED